jgi:hypothetical protein
MGASDVFLYIDTAVSLVWNIGPPVPIYRQLQILRARHVNLPRRNAGLF